MEIKFRYLILLIGLFVVAKIVFFYLTPAEWGDSYRFFRAGEYISHFSYPADEKRLPLFPLMLSPAFFLKIDALIWGRIVVLGFSVLCLLLSYKLGNLILKDSKLSLLAVALTAFSPPFFYWTGKVYAETLFTFLVLLAFVVFFGKGVKHKDFLLGMLCGLAFMTRFEGFFLFIAIFGGLFLARRNVRGLLLFLASFGFISLPYFLYRFISLNTISSSYFSEVSQFSFNLKFILSFFASLAFLFGFVPLFYIPIIKKFVVKRSISKYFPVVLFVLFELVLAFIWQAAVPRIFVPIIPILSIGLAFLLYKGTTLKVSAVIGSFTPLLILFLLGRFYLRLPFLVSGKVVLIPLLLSLTYVLYLLFRKQHYIHILIFAGVLSSLFVTCFFKNVYKTVYQASIFAQKLEGRIAYSDETGVTGWYLRGGKGVFYDRDYSDAGEYNWLRANNISYIIDTNEHGEGSKLELFRSEEYKNKFELVKKFKSNVGTAEIRSVVYKIL